MLHNITLVLLLLLSDVDNVSPFVKPTQRRPSSLYQQHAAKETLVFIGDFSHESDPIACSKEQVVNFLQQPETMLMLLGAGGKREVVVYPSLSAEMNQLWIDACVKFDAYGNDNLPSPSDTAITCDSIIQFPGLRLVITVLNGVKIKLDSNGIPKYVFVLIGEKKIASGATPIVWLYNRLTGAVKEDNDTYNLSDANAKSTVSVATENGSFSFKFDLQLRIKVEFPKTLLRILPASKDSMEEQGSSAVRRAVSQDVIDSINSTVETFLSKITRSKELC
jgi:hypothetical protein